LLTYKVPSKPNRHRVARWRKFKGLGAVYLQKGATLLPMRDDHRRALKMIVMEIAQYWWRGGPPSAGKPPGPVGRCLSWSCE